MRSDTQGDWTRTCQKYSTSKTTERFSSTRISLSFNYYLTTAISSLLDMVPKEGSLDANPFSSIVQLIFMAITMMNTLICRFEMKPPGQFLGPTEKGMKDI